MINNEEAGLEGSSINKPSDKNIGDDNDEHVNLLEERIEIGNGMYITICSNPLAQL